MAIAVEHRPLDGGRRAVGHGFVDWASEGKGVFWLLATLAVTQVRIPSWVVVVVSVLVGGGGGSGSNEERYIRYVALVEAI